MTMSVWKRTVIGDIAIHIGHKFTVINFGQNICLQELPTLLAVQN